MEQKDLEDFGIRMAGALLGAAEDVAFEANYNANPTPNQFPYIAPLGNGFPPLDDLIVGGLAIPPWVIGILAEEDGKKKGDTQEQNTGKLVKKIGEGDVCYALPMLIHHTLARQTNTGSPGVSPAAQRVTIPQGSPQNNRPPTAIVVKF